MERLKKNLVCLEYQVTGSEDWDSDIQLMTDQEIATYPRFDENGVKISTVRKVWTFGQYANQYGGDALDQVINALTMAPYLIDDKVH